VLGFTPESRATALDENLSGVNTATLAYAVFHTLALKPGSDNPVSKPRDQGGHNFILFLERVTSDPEEAH